jgi:F0F1-type ATP synthase delta subunit
MRYTPKKYAQALFEATNGASKSEQEKLFGAFAQLLKRNNDSSLLPRILTAYEQRARAVRGEHKVTITTAKKAQKALLEKVQKRFNGKADIVEEVDERVLGGIKVLIDDQYVIDATFQGRVEQLYNHLLEAANK